MDHQLMFLWDKIYKFQDLKRGGLRTMFKIFKPFAEGIGVDYKV